MKISFRIILINFAIVVVILGSSAIAFYSVMYNLLSSQQTRYLLNSTNDFVYAYREISQDCQDDFNYITNEEINSTLPTSLENRKYIDFIFQVDSTNSTIKNEVHKNFVTLPNEKFTLNEFLFNNPYALILTAKKDNGQIYYYGRILTQVYLDELSKKINADIALIWQNSPSEISNANQNSKYTYLLNEAYSKLSTKNNFDTYSESSGNNDILAAVYRPNDSSVKNNLSFLIFTNLNEAADLRSNLRYILIVIGSAGILLALILTYLFTDRLRKQITQLSDATEFTKDGNFKNKIEIKSKDEIGQLAGAFNDMLDELKKNEKAKNEYAEFITLINRNPTLSEISDAALKKIIKTGSFIIGALYVVENDALKLSSSYGLKQDFVKEKSLDIYSSVIKEKEALEINADDELPLVSTGTISFRIKSLLVLPIVYNTKVIAILELGSINKPTEETKEYLSKIKEQLAIGLTNASAFVQLENLVSELKQLNEDYQKQNVQVRKQNETLVELHKKLKEKAAELEVQKLKAEEATKLKSHFLASMSHELRTPMNSILGLTELILEDKNLIGKNRERIEVVLKSGKRLMNLINDILDLSKIEAGRMEIHEENVFLDELLKEVEASINPLVANKSFTFKILRNSNTNVYVNTDRGKVTQVLINLLGNAVKFTDSGFVELRVRITSNDDLEFKIVDSGIGMSEEDQKIIFEEFRQIDGTSTRKYSGTGLGLAICNRIADLLNGTISVKSELGNGSTFTFSIPVNYVKQKSDHLVRPISIETLIKNRKNPILVIDDNEEVRYTIGQYLIAKDYEVVYADNLEDIVEQVIKLQPFAITLDVMMPKKDGWTILKELKENPKTQNIPVILISIMGDKNLGYSLGAFEYFVKPISSDKLIQAFNRLEKLAQKRIEKIVIVDDDELEFEKFKNAFKNEKIRIEYIKDSELAFSKILEVQPDLIILDLLMPNVDGITLSHKLKENVETKHIPIIISTAKDLSEEERKSLNSIVEQITVKSQGHPLDVLKVVKERLIMHEDSTSIEAKSEEPKWTKPEFMIEDANTSDNTSNANYKGEVLIVDDDPDTLFTVNEIVQACNCKTIMSNSGAECLTILESKTPDLILLDIMMPGMDGFQTFTKIRSNEKWADIPVFAVTAKAMIEDRRVILKHGFDDYIAKPVNSGIMAFKIEKLLSKHKIS